VFNKPDAFTCVKEGMLNFKSSKIASLDEYLNYLKHYGQNVIEILTFNMFNTTRKWKYNVYVAKQNVNILIFLIPIIYLFISHRFWKAFQNFLNSLQLVSVILVNHNLVLLNIEVSFYFFLKV
jgi:hypothetical protein